MAFVVKDRVKETTTTTGTGTLTLLGAATGCQAFSVIGNANTTRYGLLDANGTAWEIGLGTYTLAGTTLARTLVLASSTGSAISLSAGTHTVFCQIAGVDGQSLLNAAQTYISGLVVTKTSAANTIDISAGYCYDPSSGKIISYAGATGVAVGSLGNSQWNQVFIYDNAGTSTIEVTNNASPPSTAYAGTARQGGTNSNRRWLDSFLTTGAAAIVDADKQELPGGGVAVSPRVTNSASPYRVLSAGASTTFAAVSLLGAVPRYAATEVAFAVQVLNGTVSHRFLTLSIDGTNGIATVRGYTDGTAGTGGTISVAMDTSVPQIYYKVDAGTSTGYLDTQSYKIAR